MFKENDTIILKEDIPAKGLKAGDIGTVALVHETGDAPLDNTDAAPCQRRARTEGRERCPHRSGYSSWTITVCSARV